MLMSYNRGDRGKCPHCSTVVLFTEPTLPDNPQIVISDESQDRVSVLIEDIAQCPNCRNVVIALSNGRMTAEGIMPHGQQVLIYPQGASRPVAAEVPRHIAGDFREAVAVLPFSPKASAALSRRCLQNVLRESGNTTKKDLADQIDEVLPTLPGYLREDVDAIRQVGNFAAHPAKSKSTGEIVDVEPEEAEWNLDVLDLLFDFYYVQPGLSQAKRNRLNKKLDDLGKPPLKR
jgi:hypothetical protein